MFSVDCSIIYKVVHDYFHLVWTWGFCSQNILSRLRCEKFALKRDLLSLFCTIKAKANVWLLFNLSFRRRVFIKQLFDTNFVVVIEIVFVYEGRELPLLMRIILLLLSASEMDATELRAEVNKSRWKPLSLTTVKTISS